MASNSPFAQPVHDFLTYLRVEAGVALATLDAYGRDLRDLVDQLTAEQVPDPGAVTAEHLVGHVKALHRTRGLQPSSIARHLATIRVFFRFLAANGVIAEDPARILETPTRWHRLPDVLSPRQMKRMLEAPRPEWGRLWLRDKAMLETMYGGGFARRRSPWFACVTTTSRSACSS